MIPHNRPTLDVAEQAAASKCIGSGWVAEGSEVNAFEEEIAAFFGLPPKNVVVVSSGSAALYLALWVLGAEKKRIAAPVYSCSALRNAVHMVGGKFVPLDCAHGSPNISISSAQKNADILIAPSMFGIPLEVAGTIECKLIEDIAQSFGATDESGGLIGLRGDVGICSFYATKMITSGGQGGALMSRDAELVAQVRDYREFDCRADDMARFNFQLTDLQAAIGRIQLARLPEFIERRTRVMDIYIQSGVELLGKGLSGAVPFRAVMNCRSPKKVIEALAREGYSSIIPIEEYELLDSPAVHPNARTLSHTTVSLPIYPTLQMSSARSIARIIGNFRT